MINSKQQHFKQIIAIIPRLLTQLDRDPLSPTYGCFDRNYWHYKIRDFPSMVLHQNVLTLVLLYKNNFPGNYFYQNSNILEFIMASLSFWCQAQHANGGFDEYWPYEDGYPPLAFSFYAVARSFRELELKDLKILRHLELAYQHWIKRVETQANNQEMAGIAGAYQYYLITQRDDVKKQFEHRLDLLLKRQDSEGWFAEYGGADIGYSSVLLHYLTDVQEFSNSKQLQKNVEKLVNFLCNFIHPDGTLGGEYGSRNTEYFLLKGLVSACKYVPSAKPMIQNIDWSLDSIDDRYLFHYIFYSYVEGVLAVDDWNKYKLHHAKKNSTYSKFFPNSGLFVKSSKSQYFVANLKKGGVFKHYKQDKLVAQDAGYRIPANQGKDKYFVNAWIDDEAEISINKKCDSLTLKSSFFVNKFFVPSPSKHMVLRMLSPMFGSALISKLKKLFIFQDTKSDYSFKRTITFKRNKVEIKDKVDQRLSSSPIYSLSVGAMRLVPSANFFNKEIIQIPLIRKLSK